MSIVAVKAAKELSQSDIDALKWLLGDARLIAKESIEGLFVGPRKEMVTPWSTTAVEITQNMNIGGIERMEEYFPVAKKSEPQYDKMLQRLYNGLNQEIFSVNRKPEDIIYIKDIAAYNKEEGLALNKEELGYLEELSKKLGRPLTDSEVFGFSQVNSEHCRHKIFNGTFIIDGKRMESSLFQLIKKTSKENPNLIVSAYKDNCAFIEGPKVKMFFPKSATAPDFFTTKERETVISLKAETHNFPTTVEPFNGAATGTGGEIRDRMAGGQGSFPIAGTAVYMASYPRIEKDKQGKPIREWEKGKPRKWLYQSPQEILTKASDGASDFGNKFGQTIICGSLLTFEHAQNGKGVEKENPKFGYDKVIMLAGGVGYAKRSDASKKEPKKGDQLILLGGDNYRIGMGGGAVSSVNTGEYGNQIELNAIQRANAEMQKRDYNAIRALAEKDENPIISVHDHGAGGHLNCLSELVEATGGEVDISKLPIGDPTLSLKEIIGNESQERMGLAIGKEGADELQQIAQRERAPFYRIGEVTDNHRFTLIDKKSGKAAIDLQMSDMFGNAPKTIMKDESAPYKFNPLKISADKFSNYLTSVLKLESVGCKDWLTNKVDRSVTGLIALQQCCGEIQLPLNNLAVTAIGYANKEGIATSIGHAPVAALIDSAAGSRLAIAEALTNIVWAPLKNGLKGVSLSANWMWPSRNKGEDARLYCAVEAVSNFACALGINVPTGKDSMSMTQSYPNGEKVLAPGTVIISTVAPVKDISNTVTPVLKDVAKSSILYIPFTKCGYELGGSALAQTLGQIGEKAPDITDASYFAACFELVQQMVESKEILAGHDVSAGGLITTLLEMNFANTKGGISINNISLPMVNFFFSEKPAVVVQIENKRLKQIQARCAALGVEAINIGSYTKERKLSILGKIKLDIDKLRDIWYSPSYLLEQYQTNRTCAKERAANYKKQPLKFRFPKNFLNGAPYYNELIKATLQQRKNAPVAAIIREKGSNGDREMAWCLYLAGFNVKDVHMTDLTSGREDLKDVQMIVFVGGFSNADTLGSAKGWAGAFLYNQKATKALNDFYARKDTLSLGICNGCQLMAELGLITPSQRENSPKMAHNNSGKFESGFVGVDIPKSSSILLKSLSGSKLGIWIAHGEGKFTFPAGNLTKSGKIATKGKTDMEIALKYSYNSYPANPNGSPFAIAGVCSPDGRHLAMMPHPERCIRPWNWAHYPIVKTEGREELKEITPWIEMFINGRKWCQKHQAKKR